LPQFGQATKSTATAAPQLVQSVRTSRTSVTTRSSSSGVVMPLFTFARPSSPSVIMPLATAISRICASESRAERDEAGLNQALANLLSHPGPFKHP